VSKAHRVLRAGLAEHPALRAWRALSPAHAAPDHLVLLKRKAEGAVLRLPGVGPGGAAVIAKRCRREKAAIERAVYERVLPRLPVPSLAYHGAVDDEDGRFAWLFLEDVGGERYAPEDRGHRELAARWLAHLHGAALEPELRAVFPDRGPEHYRRELGAVCGLLPEARALAARTPRGAAGLERIAALCEALASGWSAVDALCARAPRALVHGDCLAKNVHFRGAGAARRVAPFDWGGAGWGVAGTDLGQLALPRRGPPEDAPDHAAYLDVARRRWPQLELDTVRRLAELGQLFWALKVIRRALPELACEWARPEDVLADLAVYEAALARSVGALRAGGGAHRGAASAPVSRPASDGAGPVATSSDADARAALLAWRSLGAGRAEPERLEVLKRDRAGTLVCRLGFAGGAAVVAKRSPRASAAVERTVYEALLPGLPVPSPRYHGTLEEPGADFAWLFLDEVTGSRFRPDRPSHRAAAARWLAALHRGVAARPRVPALPDRDPAHYGRILERGRAALLARRSDGAGGADTVLGGVLAQLEALAARWDDLSGACAGVPPTLVHGDFVDHNARVHDAPAGPAFLAFDWEKAGWGVPAEDLASVDLDTYRASGGGASGLAPDALRRLAGAGRVFRCLVFLDWATSGRTSFAPGEELAQLELCRSWLEGLLRREVWR
jgi:aminoglycoside phosphotransferase (APT) family kinase protein